MMPLYSDLGCKLQNAYDTFLFLLDLSLSQLTLKTHLKMETHDFENNLITLCESEIFSFTIDFRCALNQKSNFISAIENRLTQILRILHSIFDIVRITKACHNFTRNIANSISQPSIFKHKSLMINSSIGILFNIFKTL